MITQNRAKTKPGIWQWLGCRASETADRSRAVNRLSLAEASLHSGIAVGHGEVAAGSDGVDGDRDGTEEGIGLLDAGDGVGGGEGGQFLAAEVDVLERDG
jgi:hypothetical protein